MISLYHLLLVGGALLALSIVLTPLSARIGMPVLLLFFGVGMLAGEDGPGGIEFDDFNTAFTIANLALAVILLDGGMRTRVETFRVALRPAAVLASVGVLITALITGLAAAWLLELPLLYGLLMGSIVASTDAAAVFSLLQGRGLHLNERVGATLEIESGSNDPMAIFLTVLMLELIGSGGQFTWSSAQLLLEQFGIGAIGGAAGGWLLTWMLRKLELEAGLYVLLVTTTGIAVFALIGLIGGSGFLAIYIVGLWLGNSRINWLGNILQMHDGLAWLAQLSLFLILGLLVTPSEMAAVALPALGVALVLMLVARPLSVLLSLWPFRMDRRELTYISWVGLRGAVPIVLALFPVMAQLDEAQLLFNVTCVVVVLSLVLQGATLTPMARWLKLEVPAPRLPQRHIPLALPDNSDHELYLLPVREIGDGRPTPQSLRLPHGSALVAVFRQHELLLPADVKQLEPQDWIAVAGSSRAAADIGSLLQPVQTREQLQPRQFFGEFTLSGEAKLTDLEQVYGIDIDAGMRELSLSAVIAKRHHGHPVVGDKVSVGPVQLVVMAVDGDRVTRVGLKLPT